MNLTNKIALIPGASRPIGRAIARKFLDHGASLVLPVYHDWQESTDEMKKEFSSRGADILCVPCDLTSRQETETLILKTRKYYGGLHYLVNNIERGGMPIVHGSYLKEANRDQWDLEFDTTIKAKWNLFQFGLDLMKDSGGGSVTNISSIAGIIGRSGPASYLFNDGYSAANRSIQLLTETWSRQAPPEIRVNEVMIGLIDGRHAQKTRGWSLLSEQQKSEIIDHILLKRTGKPEEVAAAVFFLAVEALYATGSCLKIDGGFCLGNAPVHTMPDGVL